MQFLGHFWPLWEYFWGTKCHLTFTKFTLEVVHIRVKSRVVFWVSGKRFSMEEVVKSSQSSNSWKKKIFLEIHNGCKNAPIDPKFFLGSPFLFKLLTYQSLRGKNVLKWPGKIMEHWKIKENLKILIFQSYFDTEDQLWISWNFLQIF